MFSGFIGEYQHNLDAKGRLIMPAKFREPLGPVFIATKGLDTCLNVYPLAEWKQLEEKIKQLPTTKADVRAFLRYFFSGAAECEQDKQGRVLLPANLREHARLDKDVVVVGVYTKVEIWSREEWERYNEDNVGDISQIANDLNIGI